MTNDYQPKKLKYLIIGLTGIVSIATCWFSVYVFQQKLTIETEQRELQLDNGDLRGKLDIIRNAEAFADTAGPFGTAQIFSIVAENADQYQIRLKGFTPAKDSDELLIKLIGTYPKAIYFFEGLYQHKLGYIRKIELKKYAQEPNASVEILVTLTTSSKGGKPK